MGSFEESSHEDGPSKVTENMEIKRL